MPVVAPDGSLVGRVIDVGPRRRDDPRAHRSRVRGRREGARAPGFDAATGTAQGQVGSHEHARRATSTRRAKVVVGDHDRHVAAVDELIRPTFRSARVTKIVDQPGRASAATCSSRPYVDLGGLDYVVGDALGAGPGRRSCADDHDDHDARRRRRRRRDHDDGDRLTRAADARRCGCSC